MQRGLQSFAQLENRLEGELARAKLISQPAFPLVADDWVNGRALNEEDFKGKVVLLDFWAVWCGPCRVLGPVIEELAAHYDGAVKVVKLNVDENPETAQAYGVTSIPTVVLFHDGDVVTSLVGVQPKQQYQRALDTLIAVA